MDTPVAHDDPIAAGTTLEWLPEAIQDTEPAFATADSTDATKALRADVRRVGGLLGDTLVRQHGAELLELVERVRKLTKQSQEAESDDERTAAIDEVRALLGGLPLDQATALVRAFAVVLPPGQRRRAGAPGAGPALPPGRGGLAGHARSRRSRRRSARPGWPRRSPRSRCVRCSPRTRPRRAAVRCSPSCAGSPTSWPRRPTPGTTARRRQDRELAELVELIWQTDELRQVRPTPVDEARNALYYFDDIVRETVPALTAELAAELADHGVALPHDAAPLHVRHLDRRRPRRQPQRHRRHHPSGAAAQPPGGDPAGPGRAGAR